MDFQTWFTSRDWVATGTWVAAFIAAISAFVTVWWPWYTRLQPVLHAERSFINLSKDQAASLIVACNLQQPTLMWKLRNDGDGAALNIEISTPAGYEAKLLKLIGDTGLILSSRVPALPPGEETTVVFYPLDDQNREEVLLNVEWSESPIRLKRNQKGKQFSVPGKLPAKRPLEYQESILARHAISQVARTHGYSFEQMLQVIGLSEEDFAQATQPDQAPDQ